MFKRCDNLKNYFNLMRVKHYIKNFLIFLPLFFNGGIFTYKIINCILGFISFCFLSSIIYVINDINDIEEDKKHPIKKSRPLASGDITLNKAKYNNINENLSKFKEKKYFANSCLGSS